MKESAEMKNRDRVITIPVLLNEKTFRNFALFDSFWVKKRWIRPVVFAVLMIGFALVCLLLKKEQSGMIAAVLLAIGLGLPLIYIGSFLSQVNMLAIKNHLSPARKVYTVILQDKGIRAVNHQIKEPDLEVSWKDTWKAFYRKDCVYLYISPARAFLLPKGQADVADEVLRKFLRSHIQ
ncbi:MAG: hypothetical protein J6P72_04760 [Firmicutes bacterium]|nr:hypothetical protein [Bacillota bacterium]